MYPTLSDYNTSAGIGTILIAAADISPMLFPMILFGFFLVVFLGVMFAQYRLNNKMEFASSFMAGMFSTTLLSFLMSLIDGLISGWVITICIGGSIIAAFILFMQSKESM